MYDSDCMPTHSYKQKFSVNIFLPLTFSYVLGGQKNRLIETILLSNHNTMCMG